MLNRISGLLSSDLAVDLGTANTLIGVPGTGLVLNEPSVVAVSEGTNRVLSGGCAVGSAPSKCWADAGLDLRGRPLREGVITDFELCEAMLRNSCAKHSGKPGGPHAC